MIRWLTYYASQDLYLQSSCLHSRAASRESECHKSGILAGTTSVFMRFSSVILSVLCFFFEEYSTECLVSTHVEFVSLGYLPSLRVSIPSVVFFFPKLSQPRCVSLHALLTHLSLWHFLSPGISIPLDVSFSLPFPPKGILILSLVSLQAFLTHLTPRHFLSPGVSSPSVVPTGPRPVVRQSRPFHRSAVHHL